MAGISRSATIAIAYIMKKYEWPYFTAYYYLKEKRPMIDPNPEFKK